MSQNVDFIRNLFAGAGSMDKEAMLAALPELIPQIADPEIEWIEDPTRAEHLSRARWRARLLEAVAR